MTRWSLLGFAAFFSLALALLHLGRDAAQDEQEPDIVSAVSEVSEIQLESEIQFESRTKGAIHPSDLYSKLTESSDYWSYSLRSRLLALPPSELLAFLERDELLVRDDARDMIVDLASWCAGALMFAKEKAQASEMGRELVFHDKRVFERMQKAFNGGWCGRFARAPDTYDRMKRLQEVIDLSDLPGQDRYERVMTQVQEAAARNDGSLQAMISSDRADLISVAMYEIVQQRDSSVIADWTTINELSLNQVQSLLPHLRIGLECQQLGRCSARDNPAISAACFNTGLHCSTGTDFYSIMRRSLSPIQFEALMTLMNSVNVYRREHGG